LPSAFLWPVGEFRPNGEGRQYLSSAHIDGRPEAFAEFGLSDLSPEPRFTNFVGNHFKDGAFTPLHSDPSPAGQAHVRINWMLKKPSVGGDPILGGKVIHVDEGDLWICFASEERHGSTPISGGERLICSFGALVPRNEAVRVMEQVR
jgi:hypothetical protein